MLELYLEMIGNLKKIGINQVGTAGMGGIGKTKLALEFPFRFSFGFRAIYRVPAADPYSWARRDVLAGLLFIAFRAEKGFYLYPFPF